MIGHIVHIGLGNFARAHLLDYTADAGGWEVTGVSLRSATVRDGLAAQSFAYDLCVQGVGVKRISVLRDVLVAPEDPARVLAAMRDADIISATVTEKGYHLDATGALDLTDPDIAVELTGQGPRTLIGFLAHALAGRERPVTVLSCDNLSDNGSTLKQAVLCFAKAAGLQIDMGNIRFPNAMVDRITPATTDAVRAISGDAMAVPTEAFREWVIEDDFAGPRPDWPDVQFVEDVAPHELRKLRMLNGAHSFMAYAGVLAGHEFVHEAVADPVLRSQVEQLMAEAGATLPISQQAQVPTYTAALLCRFENPEINHRLRQIGMDGTQKLPHRFVATLRDAGDKAPTAAAGLRAWMDFVRAETEAGRALDDPLHAELSQAVQSTDPTRALLKLLNAEDLLPLIPA